MPITTQNIAKGVPPRLHEPKSKSRKRVRIDSLDSSEDSAPKPKVKKKKKQLCKEVETEPEVEEVEDDVDPPAQEVEEVDTIQVTSDGADEHEVSTFIRCTGPTHWIRNNYRATVSFNINEALIWKNYQWKRIWQLTFCSSCQIGLPSRWQPTSTRPRLGGGAQFASECNK